MSKIIQINKNEKGFTLLELLVAITVLAIGLLGIAGLQGTTIKRNVSAMRNTEATALIEDKIEDIRSKDFDSVTSDATETGLGTGGVFTRSCTVLNNTPIAISTKTVIVKVSWNDPGRRELSFQTILSR